MELALGKKDYERVFLLMNGFKDCLYGPWKKYLPGNEEYEPSVLFDLYFDDLALPIIDKAENLCDESLTAKITPERLRELEHSSWSLDEKNLGDYKKMSWLGMGKLISFGCRLL